MDWFFLAFISMLAKSGQNFAEKLGQQKFGSFVIMFLLLFISTLILTPLILLTEPVPQFGPVFYLSIGLSCLLYIVAKPLRLFALGTGDISEIVPLISFQSVLSLGLGWVILNEVPTKWGLLGVTLISLGGYLINFDRKLCLKERLIAPFKKIYQNKSQLFLVVSLLIGSVLSVVDKMAINDTYPKSPHYVLLAEQLVCLPLVSLIIFQKKSDIKKFTKFDNLKIPLIIALLYTVRNFFNFSALGLGKVGYVVAIGQLSSLIAVFGGVFLLKENGFRKKIASAVLMGAGAVLIGWLG